MVECGSSGGFVIEAEEVGAGLHVAGSGALVELFFSAGVNEGGVAKPFVGIAPFFVAYASDFGIGSGVDEGFAIHDEGIGVTFWLIRLVINSFGFGGGAFRFRG